MKRFIVMALAVMCILPVAAKDKKKEEKSNKPVFTTIKENPITSSKDQNRSGTCWD